MDENLVMGLFLALPCALAALLVAFARRLRSRGTRIGWARLVLGNLLVLFFLLSLLLVGGEGYYRFGYDTTDSLNYTKVSKRWFERYWHLNAAGCRDNVPYSYPRQPDRRRITFVGDSFTVGQGVKDVEDRFANRIRQAHPEWDIQVLAQLGFDTGDELKLMEWLFSNRYQADQVVLVYCLNDVADLYPERRQDVRNILVEADQGGWLRRHSYFLDTLHHRLEARHNPYMKNYFEFVREGYRGPVWAQQRVRLKAFRDLVEAHGGRLLVVTFPFFHALGPNDEFQFVHDELDQFWREMNVPHLDLLPLYRSLPARKLTVNRLDAHPNELAHALAAGAIEKFLEQQLAAAPVPRTNSPAPAGGNR
jgi:lysophospholipase L1-like esterase